MRSYSFNCNFTCNLRILTTRRHVELEDTILLSIGPAWELYPKPSNSERMLVTSSGTYILWGDNDDFVKTKNDQSGSSNSSLDPCRNDGLSPLVLRERMCPAVGRT